MTIEKVDEDHLRKLWEESNDKATLFYVNGKVTLAVTWQGAESLERSYGDRAVPIIDRLDLHRILEGEWNEREAQALAEQINDREDLNPALDVPAVAYAAFIGGRGGDLM